MQVPASYRRFALWLIFGLFAVRILTLQLSPYGLHGDEAQYWAWAQDLDWGYFSKPPMIAWIIAATTAIFGDAEWAIRLASPVLHSATAYLIFLSGQKAFSARAGFWASAIYMLMPAVLVSSMIISTDAALLFFWALALHGWVSMRQNPSWCWALQIGVAIGLGLMSKYAMLFFIPPLILACMFDRNTRAALVNIKGVMAVLLAVVIIAPNIWWNKTHNFATLAHTADNANLETQTVFFHPLELGLFLLFCCLSRFLGG
jgi:4-amino-4-deoxy-L-arabinose transferase-like glycosyltransferase